MLHSGHAAQPSPIVMEVSTMPTTASHSRLRHAVARALLLTIMVAAPLRAQTDDPLPDDIEGLIDEAVVPPAEEPGDLPLLDELEEYHAHRIDLLTTTADPLARLPGITIRDAGEILRFVDSAAPSRMADLDAIGWLTPAQRLVLRLFTTLRQTRHEPPPGLLVAIRSRVATDLQTRRGYRDTVYRVAPLRNDAGDSLGLDTIPIGHSYLGSPLGVRERVLLSYDRYAAGITFEKDPGEPILHDDTLAQGTGRYALLAPDPPAGEAERRMGAFISAHATARLGPVTLIAGDYSASFGHGLLLGESFGGFKGGEVASGPFARSGGLAPYRSSGESGFFRGAAAGIDGLPGGIGARLFVSARHLDATIVPSPEDPTLGIISAIRDDGYRRTRAELRRSGNLEERLAGINIERKFRGGSLGITAYRTVYDASPEAPAISPSPLTLVSIDGSYGFGRSMLTGEIARGDDGAIAAVGGFATRLGKVRLALAGRILPATFLTPHGRVFGESPSRPGNELGIYTALEAALSPSLSLGSYLDCYRIPEKTASVPFPRSGTDASLRLDYAPARGISLHAQIRNEMKEEAITIHDTAEVARKRMIGVETTGGRLEVAVSTPGERARLRGRYERRFVARGGGIPASDGLLAFVDARWAPSRALTIGGRLALFDTDDFDAALREFEGDPSGGLAAPALSGAGRRFYLQARWQPLPLLAISAKYAETVYTDRATIAPGDLQEIAGRMASGVVVQVEVRIGSGNAKF
jgi:hypothetical protein